MLLDHLLETIGQDRMRMVDMVVHPDLEHQELAVQIHFFVAALLAGEDYFAFCLHKLSMHTGA